MWSTFIVPLSLSAQIKVDSIQLHGLTYTKEWVVLRELTFQVGDSLPVENIALILERNRRNIANLNIFTEVEFESEVQGSSLSLHIHLDERFRLGGRAILALQERNSYDILGALTQQNFHRLVYGEQSEWRNITGRGEHFTWDFLWGFSRRIRFEFTKPAIIPGSMTDLELGFRYTWQPEIIIGTESGQVRWENLAEGALQRRYAGFIGIRKRLNVYQSLLLRLSYDHYFLADSIYSFDLEGGGNHYLSNSSGEERYSHVMLKYELDRRDWRSYPLSGYKLQLMGRVAGGPGASTQFGKLGVTWAHHLPLYPRLNLAYGFQSIYTIGRRLPFFEKSQVGIRRPEFPDISNELRGYKPYVIDGTWLNLAKLEFKYAIFPYRMIPMDWLGIRWIGSQALAIYATLFADIGYVRDESFGNYDQRFKDKLLRGYGVGLNLMVIYDMLWRVEYARNHLGQGGIYFHGTLPIK